MSRPILPESAYEALGLDAETIKLLMTPKSLEEPEIAAPNLLQSDEDNATAPGPNETSITLYAELLLHVRTITLFASLRTQFSRETKAKLSSDGNSITVSHEGRHATLHMPFNIQGTGDAELSLPSDPPTKDLTLRMQLEELETSDILGALQSEDRRVNVVPWDGASLDKEKALEIRCKSCDGVIVSKGSIKQWRDLPNENWAEMMDFWHCHKPDEHHLHDHAQTRAIGEKGYAAGNRLNATKGVGFVDLTSFLLQEADCVGAQVGNYLSLYFLSLGIMRKAHRVQRRRFSLYRGIIVDTIAPKKLARYTSSQRRMYPLLRVDGSPTLLSERIGVSLSLCPMTFGRDRIKSKLHQSQSCSVSLWQYQADSIQAVKTNDSLEMFVVCNNCSNTLGTLDENMNGWRIWKWNIDVGHNSSHELYRHVYSTAKWISARLLYLIENTGLRKFHIHPSSTLLPPTTNDEPSSTSDAPDPVTSFLVWVFTPDLLFASSIPSEGRHDPTRSMKVFYQRQTWQPLKPGEPESATIEDVEFPEQLFKDLERTLEESQRLLPPTARKFQGWDVGLIDRFDLRDIAKPEEAERSSDKQETEKDIEQTADSSQGGIEPVDTKTNLED